MTIAKASNYVASTSAAVAETARQLQESMAAANKDTKEVDTTLREIIDFVDHRVVNRS
ncbi:MAG: hypothetical protein Q7R30_15655 [Acidobacteriota bacterium]|nr:hypothetical protein [Acidobacteriota bacterium]